MDKTKKWRKILAMMLTIVMMLQNVQSVVWATGTENSTQETTVEKKSDAENNETATDEEQTKEETSDKSSEELTDSEEKNTEETAAVLTSKASQSVTADTVGDVISYYANYRLDVTNTGNAAAEGVKVEITLPAKDVAVDTSKTYTTGYTETVTDIGYRVLTWDNQGIAASETGTYMFSIQIPAGVTNLSDVNVVWYINGSKAEAEEWVAGSDETLAANVKADDSTGSNTDGNNSGENSDNNAGNDTSDNNQNTDNGNGGNNNGNSDSANDADRIPDNQASQILTYEGSGVNAKLLLVSENAAFPDGFSFQVNPVSAEQTEAYVQDAQESGLDVNTGAFYDVQLLYNGVNASLTSAESMQLQVDFDSPVLTDVENVTGVEVTNGDVSTDGVSGNTTSLTKTLTAKSVGMVGVVALADEGGDQNYEQPIVGNDTTIGDGNTDPTPDQTSKQVTYQGTAEDETTVKVTMTGTDLPESNDVEVTIAKFEPNDADIYTAINGAQSSTGINSSDNPLWVSEFYKVTLKNKTTQEEINLNDAKVEFSFTGKGTLNIDKDKASIYNLFIGIDNSIQVDGSSNDLLNKDERTGSVTGISFANVSSSESSKTNVFGVTAYRRPGKVISLTDKLLKNVTMQYREKGTEEWKDIPKETAIPNDSEIHVNVNYELGADTVMVVGDTLVYTLPDSLKGASYTGDITDDASKTIGWYKVEDQTVTLNFYNDSTNEHKPFFDANGVVANVKGAFSFNGSLKNISSGSGNQKVTIKIGDLELNFDVKQIPEENKNAIEISKTVVDNLGQSNGAVTRFGDKLIYTLTVTAKRENTQALTGIEITDTFKNGNLYTANLSTGLAKKTECKTKDIQELLTGFKPISNDDEYAVYWQYASNNGITGLTYTLDSNHFLKTIKSFGKDTYGKETAGTMQPGDELIIKYIVDLNDDIIMHNTAGKDLNDVTYTIGNNASVTTAENCQASTGTDTIYKYHKVWLEKKAVNVSNDTITYEVTANSAPTYNIADWTFKDTLGTDQGQQYKEIRVDWYAPGDLNTSQGHDTWSRSETTNSGNFQITDNKGGTGTPSFTWKVPKEHTNGYVYKFTYTVNLTKSDHSADYKQEFSNKIELISSNNEHHFNTSVKGNGKNEGPIDYSRFKLTKEKGVVDIANKTISWKSKISSTNYSGFKNTIPKDSVYTDTIPNDAGIHYMTANQIELIQVTRGEDKSNPDALLVKGTDYELIPTSNSTGNYKGFQIKFLKEVVAPVSITYETTANFQKASDISTVEFNNNAVFKINDAGDEWSVNSNYMYSFNRLLSKEVGTFNPEDKTLTWIIKVNSEGAFGLPAKIEIKDMLPTDLEYVNAVCETKGIKIAKKNTDSRNPIFIVDQDQPLANKSLTILVTTKVSGQLNSNEAKTYLNQASLDIGSTNYGTAKATYQLKYKVLDKEGTFRELGFVDYTIKINEARETLIPENYHASKNPLFVVDRMGSNMMLSRDDLKVYVDGTAYTDYTISQGNSKQTFVIGNLPDGKFIQIKYTVSLTDPVGPTNISNSAELWYDAVQITTDSSTQGVIIKDSNASASSGANVFLQKYNNNYEALSGAEFELGKAKEDGSGGFVEDGIIKTGTTSDNGSVQFKNLEYNTIYYLKEISAPNGYRLDETPYIFMIVKREVPGNVPSGVNIVGSGRAITIFNEEYSAETSTTLVAEKSTVNGAFENGQFSFKIEAQKDNTSKEAPLQNVAGQQVSSLMVTNNGNGRIVFGPIKFTYSDLGGQHEKTFKYKISEVIPDEATTNNKNQKIYNGIIYDTTPYWVTVTVEDNGNQTLTVKETKVSSNENMTDASNYSEKSIHFQNTYSSETAFKFTALKTLEGKSLRENQFSFKMTGDIKDEVVRNDAEGNIEFPLITITSDDFGDNGTKITRNYHFEEESAGQTKDGISYSSNRYDATVVVSYNRNSGTISIDSVKIRKNNENYQDVNGNNGTYSLSGTDPTFINTYNATGSLLIKGTKKLKYGSEYEPLTAGSYRFKLTPVENAPIHIKENEADKDETSLTVANAADGSFQFPAMYFKLKDLNNQSSAVFTYKIKEVLPDGVSAKNPTKDGITYDTKESTLNVTVVNNNNGVLSISARMDDAEYPTTGNADLLTFTNSYATAGQITFHGQKTLNGHALAERQFAFDLYDITTNVEGERIGTAFNTSNGSYTFDPVKYTLADVKDKTEEQRTRRYLIKEQIGTAEGYTYDTTNYIVTVLLTDNGKGGITTEIKSITKSGTEVTSEGNTDLNNYSFDFVNTYKAETTFTPTATKRVLPATRKQELESGSFKFNLKGTKLGANEEFPDTAQALEDLILKEIQKEVANQKDGSVTFKEITYTKGTVKDKDGNDTVVDETGKYVYKLTEIDGKLDGYMYAQKPVYIYVEVTDNHNGTLNKTVTYHTIDTTKDADTGKESSVIGNVNEAVFTNTYTGDGTLILSAVKSLTGRKAQEGQFEFRLEVSDSLNGTYKPVIKDGKEIIASNAEDGTITFPELVFKHASGDKDIYDIGTYYFRISEVRKAQDPAGYTYSGESYIVKVTVEDAETGSGKLKTTVRTIDGTGEREYSPDTLVFHNTYKASGSITLKGTKTLSGSPLVKDQFTFELLDQDQKTVLQTVKNTADGNFAFQPLTYDQSLTAATGSAEKTYYVRETVTAAEKADGITYDSTLYKVIVTIKDKGDGTLSTSSKIQTVSGTTTKDAAAIKFANTFAGTASITKTAEDGKTPLPGAEFELYAAKANGSGYDLYGRYTSDSNGKISVSGLPANSYYFVESKAPDGYLIPKDANGNPVKYSFIIGVNAGAGKVANAVADFSQTVVNGKGYGTVELTKYNTAETKTLAGAQFALYDSNGKQVAVRRNEDGNYTYSLTASENTETTLVTGKDGKITITGLMWGSYYFQETTAPDGYVLSNDKISFKVDASSFDAKGNPVTIKTKATNKATSITIEKVDENGSALAGASMAIRDPQTRQIIETWTSTSEPHVIEGVLAAGKTYYLSEQQAPNGYEIAAEQEFTVPADGKVTVTMTDKKSDGKEGSVTVTKKISLVDEDANVVEAFAKDYTTYIGIFTDPAGEHPYGGAYLQTVQIHNGSSGSVSFTGLPKGTYYIFETDANGTPIAYDDFQTGDIGSFICTVEDGDATVNVKSKSDNSVTLNNVYYDFPDGFAYNGTINITKNVIKDGESADVDDTFYAGIFTKDANGTYVLLNGMVYELLQNDTITVDVPLGGEDGSEPVTYYVMETDETGTPIDKDVFAYEVSGEGTVSLDKDNLEGAITIVNMVDEEEQITPTPTPSTPSGNTTTTTSGGTTAQVHESDSKRVIGVKTGDNTPIGAYAAVLVIAALAIAGGIFYKKKRKNDK